MKSTRRLAKLAAILGIATFVCAVPADGQDCPELIGWWQEGSATAVAAWGYHAYIGDQLGNFRVVDTSNPALPHVVGEITPYPGEVKDIAVSGDYAYAIAAGRLRVIDVSDPSNPQRVGSTSLIYGATRVAVEGDYAYVARVSQVHLTVVDVSDPTMPTPIGNLFIDGMGWGGDIDVAGGFAYLPVGLFFVVDISEPSDPVVEGSCGVPHNIGDGPSLDGAGHAFLTVWGPGPIVPGSGLVVFDVSDPERPQPIPGIFQLGAGLTDDIAVSQGFAYVARAWRLHVIDIADPNSLFEAGFYDTQELDPARIAVAGGHVYVTVRDAGMLIFRECAVLFADGFESGDTSAWSAAMP